MKNLFSSLLFAATIAVGALGWSCDPTNKEPEPDKPVIPAEPSANATLLSAGDPEHLSTSAMFGLKTELIESYVYTVEEGENKPTPDPVVMYAEADQVNPIVTDSTTVTVYGLEGTKKYTVHFAFKIKDQAKYLSKSLSTTMPEYDQLINVVVAGYREVKVQFMAAPDQHYRYAIVDKVLYNTMRGYGAGDIDLLGFGEIAKGPLLVHQYDGMTSIDIMGDEVVLAMKPSTNYVVLYAECDEEGNIASEPIGGDGGGMDPLMSASSIRPNTKYYTEECIDDWYKFTNKYAKCELWTAPARVGEGLFTIDKKKITERNAYFSVIPPKSVIRYGAALVPKSELTDVIYPVVGEDGALSYILTDLTTPVVGPNIITNGKPLEKDMTYVLILIGLCDDTAETQIVYMEEFVPVASTQPAVELEITQVPAKDNSPYFITFNVKAKNKDCVAAMYAMNYTRQWKRVVKAPITYESFTAENGTELKTEEIAALNSAEGLTMNFNSWEDTESLLCVVSFNEEDKMKGFTLTGKSLAEQPKAKVESDLFTKLLGTWDVTLTALVGTAAEKEYKFKTTIAAAPEEAPESFVPGDKEYDKLHTYFKNQALQKGMTADEAATWATEQIATQLVEYKSLSALYGKKYSNQNRLVMRGFTYNTFSGLPYNSPWDLFNNTSYSAYEVEESFLDYGSKLFLEIRKVDGKDVVTVEQNPNYISAFSSYTYNKFMSGGLNESYMYLDADYPITVVNDDEFSMEYIVDYDGKPCTFMTVYTSNGGVSYNVHMKATQKIKFTRATPSAAPAQSYSIGGILNDENFERGSFDFKRTSLRYIDAKLKTIELPTVDKAMIEKSFKAKAQPFKGR